MNRRNFLRRLMATAAVVAAPPVLKMVAEAQSEWAPMPTFDDTYLRSAGWQFYRVPVFSMDVNQLYTFRDKPLYAEPPGAVYYGDGSDPF